MPVVAADLLTLVLGLLRDSVLSHLVPSIFLVSMDKIIRVVFRLGRALMLLATIFKSDGANNTGDVNRSSDACSVSPECFCSLPPGAVDSSRISVQNNTGGRSVGTRAPASREDSKSNGGSSDKILQ